MRFFVSQIRLDFMGRVSPVEKKEYVVIKSVRNVGTISAVFAAKERTKRKLRIDTITKEFSCN